MITYGINGNRKLTQDDNISDGIKPRIYFRERPVFELTSEGIHAGDSLRLAVDVDKDFLATAPMAVATGEGEEGAAQFALNCATSRFEGVINGRACLVCAYIQLTRWDGGNCEVLVDDYCYVGSLVSITGDDVEILPKPVAIPVPDVADAGKVIGVDNNGNYALQEGGGESVEQATDAEIDARESAAHVITPNNLNYSVTAALTDANKIQLTDAQKASAQDTLGVGAAPIIGTAAPTTSTVGKLMQPYLDSATGKTYKCTAITNTGTEAEPVYSYTWTDDVNADSLGNVYIGTNSDTNLVSARNVVRIGDHLQCTDNTYSNNKLILGKWNFDRNHSKFHIGIGSGNNNRKNAFEVWDNGNTYTLGSYQQSVTIIPAATTEYTLQEGVQSHVPSSASTYTLPVVTDNMRTHECILTIRFSSSVLTYAFEDSAGNAITPLPLAGTIADGSVVAFRCTWEALLNQWVIMPVMLGTYTAPEP